MNSPRYISIFILLLFLGCQAGEDTFPIKHPIENPPRFTEHKRCDNCGMDRNRFARTRYVFDTDKGRFYTCSIACLVILVKKKSVKPRNIKVAVYLNPTEMIDAEKAHYVIGSKAKGTMTRISKIAFSDRESAERFIQRYGGRLATFQEAYKEAEEELMKELKQ